MQFLISNFFYLKTSICYNEKLNNLNKYYIYEINDNKNYFIIKKYIIISYIINFIFKIIINDKKI